jgi:hypothetical protein
VIYSTFAEWNAAVSSTSTANFNGLAAGATPEPYHHAAGFQAPPVTVVGYNGAAYYLRRQSGTAASPYNWGTQAVLESANSLNARLEILVTGSPTAFGLNVMTIGYANPVGISINGGPEYTVATSGDRAAPTFWGYTGDTAITRVDVRPLAPAAVLIDNVSTAMAAVAPPPPPLSEVPETSTVLLTGGGLIVLGLWRRVR